jgi:hypothetical protein
MKTAIESITEVHEVGKVHPELYDEIKVCDRILVAAIVQLAQDVKDFKKSNPASDYQEEIPPAGSLTLASLQKQLLRCLAGKNLDEHCERALKIYNLLKSL